MPITSISPRPPLSVAYAAQLRCEGSCKPLEGRSIAVTRHVFVRSQRWGETGGAMAQIFSCSCCQTERRFGLLG